MTFWTDRRVFVTGCTGLLGSWLTRELKARGACVVGLIRDWNHESTMEIADAVDGCVEDYALIERTLAEYEIQTIFHLAAQTIVGVANGNPLSTFETNIKGTWTVLEAARRCVTRPHVICASSDKAYGDQKVLPYTEEMPLLGRFPYDASKACADILAQTYYKTCGLPVCITRCANLFGGGDLNWNRLIPGTIRSVIRGERPVLRSDGKAVRDYLYVKDAVEGYLELADRMRNRYHWGRAYNFTGKMPITALSLTDMILARMGSPLVPVVIGHATNELREQRLDATRAQTELGWKPSWSLHDGLAETIKWYRQYFNE